MDELSEDMTNDDAAHFKYAPLSFVYVERNFSIYQYLSNNRYRFKYGNIKMMFYCAI